MTSLLSEHSWFALSGLALALIASGTLAGLMAGLLGIGGGLVIVPMLYHLFGVLGASPEVNMHVAVGTSLATIMVTSLRSARAHYKRGNLDPALLRALVPGLLVGVILGGLLGGALSGGGLSLIFALIIILVALNMAWPRRVKLRGKDLPSAPWRHSVMTVIGLVSALMGIGGAALSVPFLSAYQVPIRRAVGTASALGVFISIPGALTYLATGWGLPDRPPFSLGYVNLLGFFLIVPMTYIMAPVGARLSSVINPEGLRRVFAVLLGVVAVRMLYGFIAG